MAASIAVAILRSRSSVGNPSVFTLSLSVKRCRFLFLGGASVTILALFCTRLRTRTRSRRDNWRLRRLVRSSRLSALDESLECPVLTASSFFQVGVLPSIKSRFNGTLRTHETSAIDLRIRIHHASKLFSTTISCVRRLSHYFGGFRVSRTFAAISGIPASRVAPSQRCPPYDIRQRDRNASVPPANCPVRSSKSRVVFGQT